MLLGGKTVINEQLLTIANLKYLSRTHLSNSYKFNMMKIPTKMLVLLYLSTN